MNISAESGLQSEAEWKLDSKHKLYAANCTDFKSTLYGLLKVSQMSLK